MVPMSLIRAYESELTPSWNAGCDIIDRSMPYLFSKLITLFVSSLIVASPIQS